MVSVSLAERDALAAQIRLPALSAQSPQACSSVKDPVSTAVKTASSAQTLTPATNAAPQVCLSVEVLASFVEMAV